MRMIHINNQNLWNKNCNDPLNIYSKIVLLRNEDFFSSLMQIMEKQTDVNKNLFFAFKTLDLRFWFRERFSQPSSLL